MYREENPSKETRSRAKTRNVTKKRKEKHDLLSIEIENFFAINKNRKRFGKFLFLGTINVGSNWRERMENEGAER